MTSKPTVAELTNTAEYQGIGIGLMTEVDLVRDNNGGGQLGVYLELFTERSTESGAELVATFDAGLTFAVTDNIRLDAGINIGLTDAADDLNVFVGQSTRF